MKLRGFLVVAAVLSVMVLFVAVFPTRTWLAQRSDLVATERRVAVLGKKNAELASRVQHLNTDAEIERLARRDFDLVRRGEEAYAILPSPPAPRAVKPPPPAPKRGFWHRVKDDLTFWS